MRPCTVILGFMKVARTYQVEMSKGSHVSQNRRDMGHPIFGS